MTPAALLCSAAVAGCGLGPGTSSRGTATLTVTRDYGTKTVVEASDRDPPESETVIRLLDREAEITTRYGGGFVQSIDGVSGTESQGRRNDWFFYVNGIESPVGAAQYDLSGGDRIWWDYRDWTSAMRVPAVVGSWPASGPGRVWHRPRRVRRRGESPGGGRRRGEGRAPRLAARWSPTIASGPGGAMACDPWRPRRITRGPLRERGLRDLQARRPRSVRAGAGGSAR